MVHSWRKWLPIIIRKCPVIAVKPLLVLPKPVISLRTATLLNIYICIIHTDEIKCSQYLSNAPNSAIPQQANCFVLYVLMYISRSSLSSMLLLWLFSRVVISVVCPGAITALQLLTALRISAAICLNAPIYN